MKKMANKEKSCFHIVATEREEEALRRLGFEVVEDEEAKAAAEAEAKAAANKEAEKKA